MEIKWFGQACFLITTKDEKKEDIKILIDPPSKNSGIKPPQSEINVLILSHNSHEAELKGIKGNFFLIDSPGEYDIKDIFIQTISGENGGEKKEKNFITSLETEGIRVCHLGKLSAKELLAEQIDEMGNVDILLIPIGGEEVIDAREAQKIINQIEPRVVIPMYYKTAGSKLKLEDAQSFLKIFGQENIEPQSKFSIRKDKLPSQTAIFLLKQS